MTVNILVCGDRHWADPQKIRNRLAALPPDTVIIEGGAPGADKIAHDEARSLGYLVREFPANWDRYGRAAGPIRNRQMLTEGQPERVLAFHSNLAASKGTKNMVTQAQKAGIPVEVIS